MISVREYTNNDFPALIKLWNEAFGDSEEFILSFMNLLPRLGTCLTACDEDRVLAVAYILTGSKAVLQNGSEHPVSYVYAVSTDVQSRGTGIGSILMDAVKAYVASRNETICTYPAEDWLYKWYGKTLGTVFCSYMSPHIAMAQKCDNVRQVSPEEYLRIRRSMLKGTVHLDVSPGWAEYMDMMCRFNSGGLVVTPYGICAGYINLDGDFFIQDLCSSQPELAAGAAAVFFGAERALYKSSGTSGDKFVISDNCSISPDFPWTFTFD